MGPANKTADVEFTWSFTFVRSTNDFIGVIPTPDEVFAGNVLFRLYDDGWRVDEESLAKTLLSPRRSN